MTDAEIKLECLQIAKSSPGNWGVHDVIVAAQLLYNFTKGK